MNRTRIANTILLTGALTCTGTFAGIGTAFADTQAPTTTVTDVAAKATVSDLKTATPVEVKKVDLAPTATKTTESKKTESKHEATKAEDKKTETKKSESKKSDAPQTDVSKEQKDGCDHGATGKACKPDPQPLHGKECQTHGKTGGVNEDHCAKPATPEKPSTSTPEKPGTQTPEKPGTDIPKPPTHDGCDICKLVKVQAPRVTPECGPNNDHVTLPATPGVIWNKGEWKDGKITITATSADGYTFGDHETETFTLTDENTACAPTGPATPNPDCDICTHVTVVPPVVKPVCGPDNDIVIAPITKGVVWTPGQWKDGKLTVVATSADHFTFGDHETETFTFTDENVTCSTGLPTPQPGKHTMTPGTPTTPEVTLTPNGTPEVTLTPNGTPAVDVRVAPQGGVVVTKHVARTHVAAQGTPAASDVAMAPQSSGKAPFFKSGIDDEPTNPVMPLSLAGAGLGLGLASLVRRRRTN